MEFPWAMGCRLSGFALLLIACGFPLASAQEWSGNGPVLNDVGNRSVQSLVIDPATGRIYAGTGAGTVFARHEASLSEPPQAFDDSAVTEPGLAVDIGVLANDRDPEGALDAGSIELVAGPVNGTATVHADGTVTYVPAPGFTGTDSFTYKVADRSGTLSNEATVSVTVSAPPNAAPMAHDDSATTGQGSAVTIPVLDNDIDPDGALDPATVAVRSGPANGSVAVNENGSIVYTPAGDFSGTDSFAYTVADNRGKSSNAAAVTVSVTPAANPGPPPAPPPPAPPPPAPPGGGGGSIGSLMLLALLLGIPMLSGKRPPN